MMKRSRKKGTTRARASAELFSRKWPLATVVLLCASRLGLGSSGIGVIFGRLACRLYCCYTATYPSLFSSSETAIIS